MVTQSGDPNNKSRPAYKKYCSYCHKNNHSVSNCYQKQRDGEYQRYKNQRSRTLKNHLYNTSVVNPVTRKKTEMKTKLITIPEIMTVTDITKQLFLLQRQISK